MKNISSTLATVALAWSLAACGGWGDDQTHATGPIEPVNPPVVPVTPPIVPPIIVVPPAPTAQDFVITVGKGVSETMSGIVSRANVANLSVANISVSRSGTFAECVWDQTNNILTITPRPSTEAPTDSCTIDLSDASGKTVSVLANLKDLDTKAPVLPSLIPLSTTAGVTWTQVLPVATDIGTVTYSVQRADGNIVPTTGANYTFDSVTRMLSGGTGITTTETLSYRATDAVGNSTTQNIVNNVNNIWSISTPNLESKTSTSINTAPWAGTGVSNPRVELYSDAGLTQLVATQASGDFSGLTPDTPYYAVTVVDDLNEATGIIESRRSIALSIKTDIAVVVDQPGTASISGPTTSVSGPITLTLSASDADGIASWEVTSMNIGANGVRWTVVTLRWSWVGNPPTTLNTSIWSATWNTVEYTFTITDTKWNKTMSILNVLKI